LRAAYQDVPPFIAPLFLFCLLQPELPSPPHLRIDLVFVGSMEPLVESTAMEEVAAIWAPYHVELRTSTPDVVPDGLRLAVVVATRRDDHLPGGTLGSIRFRNGMPEPTILMYPQTIDTLVSTTPEMRGNRDCLPAVHNRMAGRVFGRALAHEIGHFLLRTRQHPPSGLMRATHRSSDLIAPERQGFALSSEEVARIAEAISLSHG
jgi:hypothetical protein